LFLQESAEPSFGDSVIQKILYYLKYEFEIQTFKFSALSLILLILILLLAVLLSRYARRLLQRRVLPRLYIDAGVQYALLRIAHYIIISLSVLFALKVGFGVDLTSVAVILGFLSVGIGFGLQYIASDIVSGFILLFERPVRIGDRIKLANDLEGRVENISVRSTVIITNENLAVIVPNSRLLQNELVNYSYGSQEVRLNIPVPVAYGSDLEKVSQALTDAAGLVEEVLDDPPPRPHFAGFGDSALNLEIRLWITEPHKHPQIRSKVYFQIERLFRENGIEVPFPQRDIRLRSGAIRITEDEVRVK
jgi:small-conductance mechanosensitive channel